MIRTALPLVVLILAGCDSKPPPPPVFSVAGKVTFAGQPFPGGLLTLTSVTDPTITLDGEIANDGTFTLTTFHNGERLAGGFEGLYTVMVSSKFSAQFNGVAVYVPAQRVTVAPRDNQLAIDVNPATDKR